MSLGENGSDDTEMMATSPEMPHVRGVHQRSQRSAELERELRHERDIGRVEGRQDALAGAIDQGFAIIAHAIVGASNTASKNHREHMDQQHKQIRQDGWFQGYALFVLTGIFAALVLRMYGLIGK